MTKKRYGRIINGRPRRGSFNKTKASAKADAAQRKKAGMLTQTAKVKDGYVVFWRFKDPKKSNKSYKKLMKTIRAEDRKLINQFKKY